MDAGGGAATEPALPREFVEGLSECFLQFDADWLCIDCNRAAARFLQRPRTQIVGRMLWNFPRMSNDSPFAVICRRVLESGKPEEAEATFPRRGQSRLLLVHLIREMLRLTGTHIGCDTTHCGACTVLLDGEPVKSCTVLAVQADGREVMTVEGLERDGMLHPIQEGFWQEHGLQCGYCTPGMMMTAYALLQRNPHPDELEIRQAISGNLCRCTGYVNIVKSIQHAAESAHVS